MLKRVLSLTFIAFLTFFSTASAQVAPQDDRAADRAEIRAHIESIFQAFIDKDAEKLRATHTEDWRGFLEGSPVAIRGINEYMQAVSGGLKNPNGGMKSYKITDWDLIFQGNDLAVVCFVADVESRTGSTSKLRILDVYARRNGHWIQAGSHTTVHPQAIARQNSTPLPITPEIRKAILNVRESVWRAYFTNDRPTLEKLIPEEIITINERGNDFADRAAVFAGAQRVAESGAKLVRLEFPKTEMQIYGNTVILYTTYLYELEKDGKRTTVSGRGTEMFVQRGNALVHVGWHLDTEKGF